MRILIADDDAASSLLLRRTLEKWGHQVDHVDNGLDAWRQFQSQSPSLVISDWMMPGLDGAELCRRIRSLGSANYTYVIMLTAKVSRDERLEALRSGADDFLPKPLDIDELFARVEVARRILTMEKQLQVRSQEMLALNAQVERRNSDLAEAMDYLTFANRRFTELFEGLPAACYSWDRDGRIHEWNRAAVQMFGFQAQEVVTRRIWDVFAESRPNRQAENERSWRTMLERVFGGESLIGVELEKRNKRGARIHALCNILPMMSAEGAITGAITAQIDITERKTLERKLAEQLRLTKGFNTKLERQRGELEQMNIRLAELVTTDGLTGLKNHRHFQEILQASYSFSVRHALPFSVIMLDVDRFKQYNDQFGHPAGDDVLRTVSSLLVQGVREHDVVARYGGEEFIVLCPATNGPRAFEVADRLRLAIENHPWPLRPVTASFGVSTFCIGLASASALVDQADQALYQSKNDGRNRVTTYTDADLLSRSAVLR